MTKPINLLITHVAPMHASYFDTATQSWVTVSHKGTRLGRSPKPKTVKVGSQTRITEFDLNFLKATALTAPTIGKPYGTLRVMFEFMIKAFIENKGWRVQRNSHGHDVSDDENLIVWNQPGSVVPSGKRAALKSTAVQWKQLAIPHSLEMAELISNTILSLPMIAGKPVPTSTFIYTAIRWWSSPEARPFVEGKTQKATKKGTV